LPSVVIIKKDKKMEEFKKATTKVPKNLPFHLHALTTAGHLHAAGLNVTEQSFTEDGYPGCGLIFTPVMVVEDDTFEPIGTLPVMYEVRVNILMTIQRTAEQCGVDYRTIQRWRDAKKISFVEIDGKQLFPSEIALDYAASQGHVPGRKLWR
jgi:hypothetical protein